MTDLAESLLIGIAICAVALSLLLWVGAIDRVVRGNPLIPWSPRRPVPWTIFDVIAIGFIGLGLIQTATLIVANVLAIPTRDLVNPELSAKYQIPLLIGFGCASIVTWLISLLLLRFRAGASLSDLGYKPLQLSNDIILAFTAFVMLVVPTLAIQFVAVKAFPTDERHPFIDLIKENPDLRALIPIALAAVVVAPVVEEFIFRVLLQSWLERALKSLSAHLAPGRMMEASPQEPGVPSGEEDIRPSDGPEPGVPPRRLEINTDPTAVAVDDDSHKTQWPPIVISGVLFGLAHVGHGPAPIALFFLGIGLGYLYQRTHRVLPCMIAHALVNLLAVAQLGIYISNPSAP